MDWPQVKWFGLGVERLVGDHSENMIGGGCFGAKVPRLSGSSEGGGGKPIF